MFNGFTKREGPTIIGPLEPEAADEAIRQIDYEDQLLSALTDIAKTMQSVASALEAVEVRLSMLEDKINYGD